MEKKVVQEQSTNSINSRRRRRGQAPIDVVKPHATGLHNAEGRGRVWLRKFLFLTLKLKEKQ